MAGSHGFDKFILDLIGLPSAAMPKKAEARSGHELFDLSRLKRSCDWLTLNQNQSRRSEDHQLSLLNGSGSLTYSLAG